MLSQTNSGLTTRESTRSKSRNLRRQGTIQRYRANAPTAPLQRFLRLRGTPKGTYDITRTVNLSQIFTTNTWSNDGGTNLAAGLAFTFSVQNLRSYIGGTIDKTVAIPNAAELSALWDDIKIVQVELYFALGLGAPAADTSSYQPPMIIYGTDDNDANADVAIVQQLGDCKSWQGTTYANNTMSMTVKPKYQQIIYYTAVLNGYEPKRGYHRSDYDIEHYGVKMAMIKPATGLYASGRMNVSAKFTFRCKNLK